MTRRRIVSTVIKVIPFGYNCWEKRIFKKVSFCIEEKNLIVKSTS